MTQKELQQKHIKECFASAQRSADAFKEGKLKVESEWEKYFKELQKHSDKFELVKTQQTQNWGVYVYKVDENGKRVGHDQIRIGELSENYNDMSIVYKGELPNGENGRVHVYVEEHTTTPRGGWRSESHGYKLKVRIGYDDNKSYYKTGKPVVKIVEDYVQGLWNNHNHKLKQEELRNNAFTKAFKTYKNSIVDFGGNRVNNINTTRNQIVVKNLNGSAVVLNYHEVNGEVEFTVAHVSVGPNNADSVIKALVNMK
jgi:hypothetical protein